MESDTETPSDRPDSDHAIMSKFRKASIQAIAWALLGLAGLVGTWGGFVTASVWNLTNNCESTRARLAHVEAEGDANSAIVSKLQVDFAGHPTSKEIRDLLGRAASLERYQADDDDEVAEIKDRIVELEAIIRQLHPWSSGGLPVDPAVLDQQRRNRLQPLPQSPGQ